MSPRNQKHPLTNPQHLAALAVAALFWAVGVTMIDPRAGVGIVLCFLGIAGTVWIYARDLRRMTFSSFKDWPWLGLGIIVIEIMVPGYLLSVKAAEPAFTVAQVPNINGDCNIVGSGNSVTGGINCPKIVQPNPAKFEIGAQTVKSRNDGTFEVVISSELISQTLLKLLYVSVEGSDVIDFDFQPRMGGNSSYWYGEMNDNKARARGFSNPQPGNYTIVIHTSKMPSPSNIRIRYDIVPN